MVSENLLATYSLLSFIQDSQKVNKGKSILAIVYTNCTRNFELDVVSEGNQRSNYG